MEPALQLLRIHTANQCKVTQDRQTPNMASLIAIVSLLKCLMQAIHHGSARPKKLSSGRWWSNQLQPLNISTYPDGTYNSERPLTYSRHPKI
ncbi:MAG: hypothetical protein AAGB13_00425 [Cyanobacteria bacterium P01_F01_bin.33]